MFGESDSESPRVPSPWDCLISAPPSPAANASNSLVDNIPKLVPEAEEVRCYLTWFRYLLFIFSLLGKHRV